MAKTRWSPRATAEFEELVTYLRERNRKAASEASADIKQLSRMLGRRPDLGRPGQREDTREFSIPRWSKVMVYRVDDEGIEITTLRDTRRLHRPEPIEI